MGIEDRDWYREELRQRRRQSQPVMLFQNESKPSYKPTKRPPRLLNAATLIVVLFAFVVVLSVAIGIDR